MKMKKRFLGILLSLVMVLGLMPGMGLTAYADDDPPYKQYLNTTTVIKFDEKDWYLIYCDASTVTLLAKECVGASKYNESGSFVEYSDNPTVKTAVDDYYTKNISADAQKAVSGNAMFLLTADLANPLSPDVKKCSLQYRGWWLCSQGVNATYAASVSSSSGDVYGDKSSVTLALGVRPALTLNLSSVIFSSESKTFSLKPSHTHSFNYTATGATITATCTADGCDLPVVDTKHVATLTISANGGTYDGTTAYGATITDANSIQGDAKVQYQKKTDGSYGTATETAPTDAGEYKASITVGGATASVEYTIAQAATSITENPTADEITYGQTLANSTLTGGEASVAGGFAWKDSTIAPAVSDSQKTEYDVVFTPTDGNYGPAECKVKLTVNKADSSVAKAPTAKTLTYNGKAQELVTAGEADGGTMQYALGNATEATQLYTTSIPTATEVGTYYVWYKVKGDGNHNDSDPAPLAVTISPVDKAELNKAIADAEAYYDSIKDKAAYADVAATLKKAIDDAKTVAANPSADAGAVAEAIKAVNAGLETAKAEVAAIDKQAADEAAAKAVADAISALPAEAGVEDKAAVEAARKAYDALTEDQKKLVPEDVLKRLTTAEAQVEAAEEAAEVVSITKCRITVKDRTYTGKAVKKPVVTVMYGKVKLKEGRDYTVTYNKKARKIGTYKLKVKGKGKYTGTKTLTFRIIPKGTVFTKRTGGNKQITLTWKERKNITGYQIEYSLKKDFSGSKKILVNKPKIFTKVIRNLKPGKTYYVRIRTYKKVNRKNYVSLWSETKTVKTSGLKGNAPAQVVEVALQAGETLDLNGLFPGGDAWESSDEAVVAVSDGVASALAAGEAVVDGLNAEGEEVRVVITVTESEIGIEGLELDADLLLPGIDELDDGEIVMDEETELTLE